MIGFEHCLAADLRTKAELKWAFLALAAHAAGPRLRRLIAEWSVARTAAFLRTFAAKTVHPPLI